MHCALEGVRFVRPALFSYFLLIIFHLYFVFPANVHFFQIVG